jgi:calcium uptake protein 1, mitochondrial
MKNGLVEYLFSKDGNEHLHYDKFSSFFKQLHDEVIYFFSFFVC